MYAYLGLLIVIAIVTGILGYMRDRSSPCFKKSMRGRGFCDITRIPYRLPEGVRASILNEVHRGGGNRVSMYSMRAARTFDSQYVQKYMPDLLAAYADVQKVVSRTVGQPVYQAPLDGPLSVCVISYDKPGDAIQWHYDDNYFSGRFFTVLVPVTKERSCSSYQFRNRDGKPENVRLEETGEALLFEGNKVWHRSTPLCPDQHRVIVSFQFTTDTRIRNPVLKRIKELFF
jgi:alkylated DNA repair dioxygenase AlkB